MQQQKQSSLLAELCLLGFLLYAGWWLYTTQFQHHNQQGQGQQAALLVTTAGQHDVRGAPTLTADQVNTILSRAGSPAAGTGDTFYQESLETGINDSVALAFFQHESNMGLKGWAIVNHSIGNIRCTAGYTCNGGYRSYTSWAAGVIDWFNLIKNLYIKAWGLVTVEQIIPRYAPPGDNNNVPAYISSVIATVNSYQQQAAERGEQAP
jgi:hypothetical protein